jgi:hypothetical protein
LEHVTIKQILRREKSRNNFQIIKQNLNPRIFKGVQHLDIPVIGEKDTWIQITDQQQIEDIILLRNKALFGQASSTPFLKPTMKDTFGYEGINDQKIQFVGRGYHPTRM